MKVSFQRGGGQLNRFTWASNGRASTRNDATTLCLEVGQVKVSKHWMRIHNVVQRGGFSKDIGGSTILTSETRALKIFSESPLSI